MSYCLAPPDGPLVVQTESRLGAAGSCLENIFLSLVIPTYNERLNIEQLVDETTLVLDRVLPECYELIVVDDNSPDRTYEVVASLSNRYPKLKLLHRVAERGLATAAIRGWQVSQGNILGIIDADLQHPPYVLAELLEQIDKGADIAIASRYLTREGLGSHRQFRWWTAQLARILTQVFLPGIAGKCSDPMSGFFLFRRRVITGRLLDPSGYKILLDVLARGNTGSIKEVAFVFQQRRLGESKLTFAQCIEYCNHLRKLTLFLLKEKMKKTGDTS
jgi:dolichol-phosphate mannosyltransferase